MNIRYTTLSVLILFLACTTIAQATIRKVLFIGNSYTYTNSMPTMLQSFAAACGDTLVFDMSAPGGYTLQQHSTDATTLSRITSQQWDIVVLQEQSEMPSFPPAQVATDVYPYAAKLDTLVHNNDTCTQTMFMMTWGHRGGDAPNCASYPVVCTYAGMQGRLRESYMQMAQDNKAIVAPVGAAWKMVVDSFTSIDLYNPDDSHPSVAGSYLQACVFYASIFHKRSFGCTYLGGLPSATAQTLQRIADKVTMDSLTQWQQYGHYPYASFNHTQLTTGSVTFANHSQKAGDFVWSFGDGHNDVAASPAHVYSATGIYTVSFTANTPCFTETKYDTVHIGTTTGISVVTDHPTPVRIMQDIHGKVTFIIPDNQLYSVLEVFDATGRLVKKHQLSSGSITDDLLPGVYLYRAYTACRSIVYSNKMVILP